MCRGFCSRARNHRIWGWPLILAVLILLACAEEEERFREVIYFDDSRLTARPVWEDLFNDSHVIELQPSQVPPDAFKISMLLLDSSGNLVIPVASDSVMFFRASGEQIRVVGGKGAEPGKIVALRTIALDPHDNLYVHDLEGVRIHVFSAPDYTFSRSYGVSSFVSSFVVNGQGEIFAYFPNPDRLLRKFDPEGNLTAEAFRPDREDIAVFLSRVQNGGTATMPPSEDVAVIYPGAFAISIYGSDLAGKRQLKSRSPTRWRPRMPDFPADLSPKGMDLGHKEWWDGHTHISGLHWLGNDLIAVSLYTLKGGGPHIWYLNLYTVRGQVLAEGLAVPDGGRVVGSAPGFLYVARNPSLNEDGSVRASRLWEYRLREELRNRLH